MVLRDWREEDSVVFSRMNRDPKVMEYFLKPLTDTESRDFYERIRREIDTFGWGLFAAEVKISGKFIGYIGLHHTNFETDFCPCIEIGWRLCENSWGRGYATEGAGLVWIMLSGNYNYRRFIPLLLYPTDAPKG